MLHGDALLGVHGEVQDANNKKNCILAPSITGIVSKFQLDISILSIVCTINKILEPSGEKVSKKPPLPPPFVSRDSYSVATYVQYLCVYKTYVILISQFIIMRY